MLDYDLARFTASKIEALNQAVQAKSRAIPGRFHVSSLRPKRSQTLDNHNL